jgi:hypothetical protein
MPSFMSYSPKSVKPKVCLDFSVVAFLGMKRPSEEEEEYKPSDKEAPVPASDAVVANERKPRHRNAPVATVIDNEEPEVASAFVTVKKPANNSPVEKVKQAVKAVQGEPSKKLSKEQRVAGVRESDELRMRSVRRFSKRINDDVIAPVLAVALIAKGLVPKEEGKPDGQYETVRATVLKHRVHSGYKVTKSGKIVPRLCTLAQHVAYTVGRHVITVDDWTVDKWVRFPNVMDVVFSVGAIADTVAKLYSEETLRAVLNDAIDLATRNAQAQKQYRETGSVDNGIKVEPLS